MSSPRKYKCPYCNKTRTREQLPGHLEYNHMDMLPEGFTPLRATFHIVNNKPYTYTRPCRICGSSTDWDEHKGRYNFLCNKKSCHDAWVAKMKETMGDKMGSNRPTATKEGLQKMLSARKISGKYTFSDGGVKEYVGSYEKEALKFMDKVMYIKSEDLMCPGPFLEYIMDGKKHYYIPDMLYIPYNLIIEVKDGGDNPNTNTAMSDVRRRSIAKEKFIINNTNYNYLRLTNNDFSQLLHVFADLKMHMIDDNKERVIHVNENDVNMLEGVKDIPELIREITEKDLNRNKVLSPVFIINTYTHSKFGDLQKNFLNAKYTHSLISTDPTLRKMYTFDMRDKGFMEDTIDRYKAIKDSSMRVFCLMVSPKAKHTIDKAIEYYLANKNKTHYGVFNLLDYMNGSKKVDSQGELVMFCSEFVHAVLKSAGLDASGHSSRNTAPDDLGGKDSKVKSFKIFEGKILKFNPSKIKDTIKRLKAETTYEKLKANKTGKMTSTDDMNLGDINHWSTFGKNVMKNIQGIFTNENYMLSEEVGGIPFGCGTKDGIIVVNYLQNMVFAKPEIGIADSYELDNIVTTAGDKILHRESKDILKNSRYSVYFVECDSKKVLSTVYEYMNKAVPNQFLYNTIFGHKSYTDDQIVFESNCIPMDDFYTRLDKICEGIENYIMYDIVPEEVQNEEILNKWFVKSSDGAINCCLLIRGYDKPMRGRSSMLVLKRDGMKWRVFLRHKDREYNAPGGGWNPDETPMEAAIREAREEAFINTTDVMYGGQLIEYHEKVQDWVKEHVKDEHQWWYGYYSRIFVGEFQSDYTGKVNSMDLDSIGREGEWFDVIDVIDKIHVEYANAIAWYLKKKDPLYMSGIGKAINEYALLERKLSGYNILYHGSAIGGLKIVDNNSFNNGNRFEPARQSSFWFANMDYAAMFATAEVIYNKSKGLINILIDNDMKCLVKEDQAQIALDILKKSVGYVYQKGIDGKYITGGNGRNFPEYTIDFPVTPDFIHRLSGKQMAKYVKVVTEDYYNNIKELYKKDKMDFGADILTRIHDTFMYSPHKEIINTKKEVKKLLAKSEPTQENSFLEASKVKEDKLYHLSQSNIDNKIVKPNIPNNYMTKNGYEDSTTKRVCFSTSIDGCLRGISQNLIGKEFYVHVPDDISRYSVLKPNTDEVPDSKITQERWICTPVKMKCIGKIKVTGDKGEKGLPYKYGDDKTAELYDWNWEWVEKLDESTMTFYESKDESKLDKNFKKKSKVPYTVKEFNKTNAYKYLKELKDDVIEFNLKLKHGEILVDTTTDTAIGYVWVNFKGKYTGTISPIYVYEEYRGQGFSEILLKDAIDKYNGTKLNVYKDNEVAIRLYKKFGFKIVKEAKDHYEMELESKKPIQESTNIRLYHGSHADIENYILPKNKSFEDDNYVFATTDKNFALCYSGNMWHDGIINQGYYNNQLYLVELVQGSFDKVFNTYGYLYELEYNSQFKNRHRTEYLSKSKARIIDKIYIPNVLDAIEKSGIELYRYLNKPKWWDKFKSKKSIDESTINERTLSGTNILYHGSAYGNIKTADDDGFNNNSEFGSDDKSSLWFADYKLACMYATAEVLYREAKKQDHKIPFLLDNDGKCLIREEYSDLVLDILNHNNGYVYMKGIDNKFITEGKIRNFPEYTINASIIPDIKYTINGNEMNKFIKIVDLDYYKSIVEKYKEDKMFFGADVLVKVNNAFSLNIEKEIEKTEDKVKDILTKEPVAEGMVLNDKDIYYNKDKFDNGDINLCIITGLSGSGKTTMGITMENNKDTEVVHLDDLLVVKDHFTMENLKEYGDLIYSYFRTKGKRFYITDDDLDNIIAKDPNYQYENILFPEFVKYAEQYAKTHKNKKIVLEGVWFYVDNWFKPEQFVNYAVYIKGTSMVLSRWRAAKRDSADAGSNFNMVKAIAKNISSIKRWSQYIEDEKEITKWRDFYNKRIKESVQEPTKEDFIIR